MKYMRLRYLMHKKNLGRPYNYANQQLVIDGLCFREMYKMSGSPFIIGGEYDRYADYMRKFLSKFIKSNIKCYVIFNGAGLTTDIEKRKEIHQKIVDRVAAIQPERNNVYCEPVFVKDVALDILKELGIQYYVCMYDSKSALFSLAKKLECPILTNNIEYALYGVTVIELKSVVFDNETKSINCFVYHEEVCRRWNSFTKDIMSLVLTIVDEDSYFYNDLLNIFKSKESTFVSTILYWIRRKSKEDVINFLKSRLQIENKQKFLETYEEIRKLFFSSKSPAIAYLLNSQRLSDSGSFENDVGAGKIAIPLINLRNVGFLSGSWIVYDENREDAMLSVVDIALYTQALLRNSNEAEITFIGRDNGKSEISVIKSLINLRRDIKSKGKNSKRTINIADFKYFIACKLPAFDMETLVTVPEDCWMLLISLLYYSTKVGRNIDKEVYCFILSYVLLGPVSEKVGVIKKSNFFLTHGVEEKGSEEEAEVKTDISNNSLTINQCMQAANAVVDLFYESKDLKDNFDRDVLHTFAEFQHCLHFMNYLNRLCGEEIKSTAYHKTINCTFIYNLFVQLKNEKSPGLYIEKLLSCPEVYEYFKIILHTYFKCRSSCLGI